MPAHSFFVLKLKAVPARYGLSRNIQDLLVALDDYHRGSIDGVELGRLVRLSRNRRSAIASTIAKCAEILRKQPEEVPTCVEVIEMCTELLDIADRKPEVEGFPFKKLPAEIQEKIFRLIIDNIFHTKSVLPANNKSGNCKCPRFDRDNTFQTSQMKGIGSIFGSDAITKEFFQVFYRVKTFRFRCPCELRSHLTNNRLFLENVKNIVVHWGGLDSASTFKMLREVPSLKNLGIVISKLTYIHLNERSTMMKSFFPLAHKNVRISDVLGLDELLEIRGLRQVRVLLAASSRGGTQSHEMDRANLLELLTDKLLRPKEASLQSSREER